MDKKLSIGQKVNHLTLIKYINGNLALFKCDCGIIKYIRPSRVFTGVTKTCSCNGGTRASRNTVSEMGSVKNRSTEYIIWKQMHERCNNKNKKNWHNYGGRGISVCDRWSNKDGFLNFIKDMGKKPKNPDFWIGKRDYYSLDRTDNNGNYEPSNCRWADPNTQANNTRKTLRFDYKSKKYTISELSNLFGVNRNALYLMIYRNGIDKAIRYYSSK